jgi:hypothetical protein
MIMNDDRMVVETTISLLNFSLYEAVDPSSQVLSWIRTMIANRMASNGEEWTTIYSNYNSGTYNNQWMIIDYNKVKAAVGTGSLPDGTFWVLEQIPGNDRHPCLS